MKPWHYAVAALAIAAVIALIYSNNRDEESEVAERADDTSQTTTSGALDATLYTLSPTASIELLLEQSTLPDEAVPGLTEAQSLYEQALEVPPAEAIPLLQQAEDQLTETAELVADMAVDASNQVTADNLRRLSSSILVVRDRVQADRELLEGTGSPVPVAAQERNAA
jgi:hypothetical protein